MFVLFVCQNSGERGLIWLLHIIKQYTIYISLITPLLIFGLIWLLNLFLDNICSQTKFLPKKQIYLQVGVASYLLLQNNVYISTEVEKQTILNKSPHRSFNIILVDSISHVMYNTKCFQRKKMMLQLRYKKLTLGRTELFLIRR